MRRWTAVLCVLFLAFGCGSKEEEQPTSDDRPQEGDPCLGDEGCASPLFCAADGCLDDTQGSCIVTADLDCSGELESPVCGCDGETYANRCEAHKKRRNIEFNGPCQ
jgi:hypothetical protein